MRGTHPTATVVYGLKNDIGRDIIVSIKEMGDSIVLVEEIRSGRKRVALNSMRKYPRTVHATSILKSLYPTSETLSENGVSVVENPQLRNPNSGSLKFSRGTTKDQIAQFAQTGKIEQDLGLIETLKNDRTAEYLSGKKSSLKTTAFLFDI